MARVELRNITKRWGEFIGVDNQSLEINDREFFVLLGPSGCGKTTTMRMIAGLETPSEGEILIDNKVVTKSLPKDRDIAMVFQNYGLYPHMTIFDNIAYPLRIRSIPKQEIVPRVEQAAKRVELTQLLSRKPKALSGGQRQRVALARAIVRTPQVFLMDEPLSNLDARLRITMRAELKHLSHELKITTVYVTHDQIEAMTLADRIAVMKDGVIQQLGTPNEIYNNPSNMFVASFIGSPAMNLIHGTLDNGWFVTTGGTRLVSMNAQNSPDSSTKNIVLGVRPEDITIADTGKGNISVPVYAVENTGDSVLITAELENQRITARGDRHISRDIGDMVSLNINLERMYLFDQATQKPLLKNSNTL